MPTKTEIEREHAAGDAQTPEITIEYYEIYKFMEETPGLYGMDNRRTEAHERLCDFYDLPETESREVTDHMQDFTNPGELHLALLELVRRDRMGDSR